MPTTVFEFHEGDRVVTSLAEFARYEVPWGTEPTPEQIGTVRLVGVSGAYVVYPDGHRLAVALRDLRPAPPTIDDGLLLAFFGLTAGDEATEDYRIACLDQVLDFIAGLSPASAEKLRAELGLHKTVAL